MRLELYGPKGLPIGGGTLTGALKIGIYSGGGEGVVGLLNINNSGGDTSAIMVSYGGINYFRGFAANGVFGAATATLLNNGLLSFNGCGHNGTSFTGTKVQMSFAASENWTGTANGTRINFYVTNAGSTTIYEAASIVNGTMQVGKTTRTQAAAWGTSGTLFAVIGTQTTDSISSGTVATAVASSFGVPTFVASNATTFTDAANLYIAGDVAAGTNVTLTNSYGLWNVGKTRLDGAVIIGNALATNATAGFLYIPTCAGTPTGVPTDYTGRIPIIVDSTNHKLYFYSGGSWRDAGP